MTRAIVLLLCLAAAGTIVARTHYTAQGPGEQSAVFVIPEKTEAPARIPAPSTIIDVPTDRAALARALQRELKRVGCYSGDISGVWTTSSRMAMKSFVDRANAALPIDNPDPVLLSLVRNHQGLACIVECPPGQAAAGEGPCQPSVALVKAGDDPGGVVKDGGAERAALSTLPAAAAGLAGLATTSKSRSEKHQSIDPRTPAVAKPDPAASERDRPSTSRSKPLAKSRDRTARRQKAARPPKLIRDFLRTVERTFSPR